jgi:proteasome lid subunit RPN8/RPN11
MAMIKIYKELLSQIRLTAEKTYPNECCGLLLGAESLVREIRPAENISIGSRQRRYVIHPRDLLDAENYVRGIGMEVLGVYHSHPDHPARPSVFDRGNAVQRYVYLIVNVTRGCAGDVTCWRLGDRDSGFEPESLVILR